MKILLRINASARRNASHSRALADHFQNRWQALNSDGRVVLRDLAETPVPHLTQAAIAAFTTSGDNRPSSPDSAVALSDRLIAELAAADDVLVSSPLYNFGPPSVLKAYVDHVVRVGRTFTASEHGFAGLLKGKSVCIVTARGDASANISGETDFQGLWLQTVFRFMGFARVEWIALEGTVLGHDILNRNLARARLQVDAWFKPPPGPPPTDGIEWRGTFSTQDHAEINALRSRQVASILAGDARAYAELCAQDVALLLQGQEATFGRGPFLECATRLFQTTRFTAMRQIPLRIERQGQLAVEIGQQEVQTATGAAHGESFKTRRKYTQVLRQTPAGWRFAVLMSNNSV